ncbi:MAG TPA: glutamate--tRNA ligase family protein [Candidatus Paceibacterota bacterium]
MNNEQETIKSRGGVVVRMAPSPTGNLHIGTARAALFNYLFAKKNKGKFILRIEDTDKERSTKEFEEDIMNGFNWLGLSHDEFYRQSERTESYVSHLKKMIESGSAYISKETPTEVGERSEVIRFKNPNKKITFNDLIRGDVAFDTTELGDFVIARSIEEPLYHLAVVVDDFEMGVTHVLRGEDHISNTPRQILIQEGISAPRPIYAHLPLILGKKREKLSKRKHGKAVWVDTYRQEGFLPQALLNYFALLGWNPGNDREIFTIQELIEVFSLEKVQKSGAVFDEEKLKWVNSEHRKIQEKTDNENFEQSTIEAIGKIYKFDNDYQKSSVLEALKISGSIYTTFTEQVNFIQQALDTSPINSLRSLLWKEEKDFSNTIRHIQWVIDNFEKIPEEKWCYEEIRNAIWPYANKEGRGAVLWPIRYALSGKDKSPDPFILATLLKKNTTINKLRSVLDEIKNEK